MFNIMRMVAIAMVMAFGIVPVAVSAERAIIVLDGSGSMWAQIDGVARITIARETLSDVLQDLPGDLELGLMSYGHRVRGDCSDIELLVDAAPGTATAIEEAAAGINPIGMTPLSDAVRIAAEQLRYTEERATVILITDGLETCEIDPCQLGSELEANGIDFTTHVVGFGLSDEEGQQVACLAENTGGRYIAAEDGAALTEALAETVAEVAQAEPEPAPEPVPEPVALEFNFVPQLALSEDSDLIIDGGSNWTVFAADADGERGDEVTYGYGMPYRADLDPGDYVVVAELGEATSEQTVTIVEGEMAEPVFTLNAGQVTLRAYAAEGEPVASGAAITIVYPGGDTFGYGEATFVVPAGEQTVAAEIGQGEASETFMLAAGESVEKDLVVGIGRVRINAEYAPGMKVEAGGMGVGVVGAKVSLDGSRAEFGYGYGPDSEFDLPPGDYVAVVDLDEASAETPFTVETGALVQAVALLDAGVVAIEAAGAENLQIYSATVDIQGDRAEFGFAYGATLQTTLPAGDYMVSARYADDVEKETSFTVVAGERLDVTVEP